MVLNQIITMFAFLRTIYKTSIFSLVVFQSFEITKNGIGHGLNPFSPSQFKHPTSPYINFQKEIW